jgi:hypothetical protein
LDEVEGGQLFETRGSFSVIEPAQELAQVVAVPAHRGGGEILSSFFRPLLHPEDKLYQPRDDGAPDHAGGCSHNPHLDRQHCNLDPHVANLRM